MKYQDTIYLIRQMRNLTLKKMAEGLKVTPQYLSTVEHGRREPTINFLEKITSYHDIAMHEFFILNDLLEKHGRDGLMTKLIEMGATK